MSTHFKPAACAPVHTGRKPRRPGLLGWITTLHAVWTERRALKGMEAHRLRDLGITPGEAARESDRPAWDVPERWLR